MLFLAITNICFANLKMADIVVVAFFNLKARLIKKMIADHLKVQN